MASKKQSRFLLQQKVILGTVATLILLGLGYVSTIVVSDTASGEFVEGEHYYILDNPRRLRGDKIEIMEFFSYACAHCYNFDDDLSKWVDARREKITFIRSPVVSSKLWRLYAQTYYTMQTMGSLEQNHTRLFDGIHQANRILRSVDNLAALLAEDNPQEFIAAFNSPVVTRKVNAADKMARRFKIASVPNIVVNGKYLVKSSSRVGLSRMLDVMDYLIEKETAGATAD